MKKFTVFTSILLTAIIILLTNHLNSQGWEWQNPLPQGNDLNSSCFIDSSTGFAVGDLGTIIKTTDGGETWAIQSSGTDLDLNSVFFVDENYGYAVGRYHNYNSVFLKTTDGGINWTETSTIPHGVKDIFFTSADTGFIVGAIHDATTSGYVQRTTDGGISWGNHHQLPIGLESVYFPSKEVGYAVGQIIMKTTDAGLTWTSLYGPTWLSDVYFINENIGFVIGIGTTLKTIDGGANWIIQITGEGYLNSVFFMDEMNGYGVGDFGAIKKTTNGGVSWTNVNSGTSSDLNALCFTGSVGHIAGNNGVLLKSIDEGTTWVNQLIGPTQHLISTYFTNGHTGYAVGDSGLILKTIDAGTSWFITPSENSNRLNSVFFVNPDTGYAAGEYGTILKTNDTGNSWTKLTSGSQEFLKSIFFPNNTTGYTVGNSGTILKTVDGGLNWTRQASGADDYCLTSAYFTSENRGYVVGYLDGFFSYMRILFTNDGGANWTIQSDTFGIYNNVFFPNEDTGYIAGYGGILKTTDGGENWYAHEIVGPGIYYTNWQSIYFMNSNEGYIVGYRDEYPDDKIWILKTIDGGETYFVPEDQNLVCNQRLNSIFFPTPDTGYVVGFKGSILRMITEGNPVNINSPKTIENRIKIYPNPVSVKSNIEFELNKPAHISIQIYNSMGEKITDLANKEFPAGHQHFEWNLSGLSEGIYFCLVQIGNESVTKKIIKVN